MIKKIFIFIGLIFIFTSYYMFIYMTFGSPYFIEHYLHIKNIYVTKFFLTLSKYSDVWLFLIFFSLTFYEYIKDSKNESLFLSNKFKEIFIHMFVIALWVDIQIPVIFISFLSGIGHNASGFIYNNTKNIILFLLCCIPFISIILYFIRKLIRKK